MLIELIKFFSTTVGTNFYSFGLQLTLFISILATLYFSLQKKRFPENNIFISLLMVYILQLALGSLPSIAHYFGNDLDSMVPSIDRVLLICQLVWIFLVLRNSNFSRATILALLFFHSILIIALVGVFYYLPASVGNFNFSNEAFYWSLALFLVAICLLFVTPRAKNAFRVLHVGFFSIMAVGSLADMVFVPFVGDFSGFIRLSLILSLPAILIVPALIESNENSIDQKVIRSFISRIEQSTDELFIPTLPTNQVVPVSDNDGEIGNWTQDHKDLISEVKQPVFSILGYSDLLEREDHGQLSLVQKKYIERIKAAAGAIENRVDELLNYQEIEKGSFKIIPSKIDLEKMINKAISRSEYLINEKEIKLNVTFSLNDRVIISDKDAIQSILNLAIENAATASKTTGSIVIVAQENVENKNLIELKITDSGDGIDPEILPKIFDKRIKTNEPLLKGVGDKGVGLSIIKTLTTSLHGKISVESEIGVGTTLLINIPANLAGSFQPIIEDGSTEV